MTAGTGRQPRPRRCHGELRHDHQPIGALQGLDPDRVIYIIGTTSKSLAAAPRVCGDVCRVLNAWPSSLEQLALARFIHAGLFDRDIRRMRGIYRQRRDLLVATLAEHAPGLCVTGIAAGGHALVRLPPSGPAEIDVIAGAARRDLALHRLGDYQFLSGPGERDDYGSRS
jgi:GntR family transcriptional regulator / MocR family aminotransferase